jgi:hypothetical protein
VHGVCGRERGKTLKKELRKNRTQKEPREELRKIGGWRRIEEELREESREEQG